MPRYDYQCTSCGHQFELVQSFQEAGSGTCPMCSGAGRRHFHAVPVIYKGSGFYTTDYGRPKPPTGDGKDKEATEAKAEKAKAAKAKAETAKAEKGNETRGSDGASSNSDSKSSSTAGTAGKATK